MKSLNTITQFLLNDCKLQHFQLWKSVNGEDFKLLYSHSLSDSFIHNPTNLKFAFENGFLFTVVLKKQQLEAHIKGYLSNLIYAYYLEHMLEKETYIRHKMMESIRDISNLNNLDDLLTNILEKALSVINVADMGVLWMYNEEENVLIPKAWAGGPTEDIKNMRMRIGEGIIGTTFKENTSMTLSSITEVLKAACSMTDENLLHLQKSYHFETLQSVISVPIIVDGHTLCVLIIYQNGSAPLLSHQDQKLLESFSDQVSIALTNSRLYHHLKEQNRLLLQRDEIHDTFMKLSLQNKDLKIIANELRRMLNRKITIIDFITTHLYSNPINWHIHTVFPLMQTIFAVETAQFKTVEINNQRKTFYFHPINTVDSIIGMLIIEVNETKLSVLDKIICEQASTVIALEMIRQQSLMDSINQHTNERFNEFLQMRDYAQLCEKGNELGLDLHAYTYVLIIQQPLHTDIHHMNMQVRQLVSDSKKIFQQYISVVFGYQDKIHIVCQLPQPFKETDFASRVQALQKNWHLSNKALLRIAIGTCYQGIENIGKSYAEAEKTLSFLQSRQLNGVMHYQDIGINRLFLHQSNEEMDRFIDDVFLPLQVTQERNYLLEETLLVYMQNNRSISLTAKQLHIHVNTLYQRIKKIEEKLKVSFSNPEDMLRLQLACFLRQSNMA